MLGLVKHTLSGVRMPSAHTVSTSPLVQTLGDRFPLFMFPEYHHQCRTFPMIARLIHPMAPNSYLDSQEGPQST